MPELEREISLLITEDHALLRETLANWLRLAPDIRVVACAKSADEAVADAVRLKPDIVLMDIAMPGMSAFEATRAIRAACPRCHVIFLSAFLQDQYIEQALQAGAMGYITKGEAPETVMQAIRQVTAGEAYFSPEVLPRILIDGGVPRLAKPPVRTRYSTLTAREREVLEYLAAGLSKKEIALRMKLSVGTINNHAANLMRKLNLHDRVELTRFAIREGVVTL